MVVVAFNLYARDIGLTKAFHTWFLCRYLVDPSVASRFEYVYVGIHAETRSVLS